MAGTEPTATLPISDATKENYEQIARDRAVENNSTPKAELAKLVKLWEKYDAEEPRGGWNHLIGWAKDHDPGWSDGPDLEEAERARAAESARRDPRVAYQAHPEAVKAAEDELKHRQEELAGPRPKKAADKK